MLIKTINWGNQVIVVLFANPFYWRFKWFKRSTGLPDNGSYGEVVMCLIPFIVQNVLNSLLIKEVPLSDAITWTSTWVVNECLKLVIVALDILFSVR